MTWIDNFVDWVVIDRTSKECGREILMETKIVRGAANRGSEDGYKGIVRSSSSSSRSKLREILTPAIMITSPLNTEI